MAIVQSLPHLQVQMYGSAVASATSTYGGGTLPNLQVQIFGSVVARATNTCICKCKIVFCK